MTIVRDRSVFENAYAGKAPWDIGKPQKPVRFEIRPDMNDLGFSEGGPKAWFLVALRQN